MQTRYGFPFFLAVVAACGSTALGESVRPAVKAPARDIDREFDPDAGTEAPLDIQAESFEGETAGAADDCETIGAFTSSFQFPARYRGNLYRITDSGLTLKKIKMQLAFTGTANLYVSVHRKMPDGSYAEVDLNSAIGTPGYLFIANAQGHGASTPAFYPEDPHPGINNGAGVQLPPGDYAIGFAWGPESVKYGRDTGVVYPRPINGGSTLGSVSDELGAGEPPLSATPSLSFFSGGAYAQQLCFIPVEGACCLSNGAESRCENLLEVDCVGEGSFFHGQRTTCKDTICEFGACCFECGSAAPGQIFPAKCSDTYVAESCEAAGGINFWSGVSCPADQSQLCPKLVGACCNGTNCNLKCESECLAGGGTYEGDGTNCDPNTHKCKGACCVSGGCLDRTEASCEGVSGDFKGSGTRCFNQFCDGGCCHGFFGYEDCDIWSRDRCIYDPENFAFLAYQGDGRPCPTNAQGQLACDPPLNNPYIACCLPDGGCMNTYTNICTQSWIQGTVVAGTCGSIAPNTCSNMVAQCCFPNGNCDVLIGNACRARGGIEVVGQNSCPENACANTDFAGACCGTGVGECTKVTAPECEALHGVYQGNGTNCTNASTTCPGYGACCRGNSECLDKVTQAECSAVSGIYRGASTTCAQVACDLRGACCAVTGTCLFTTVTTCIGLGGDFKGANAPCTPGVCPSGACCLPEGCKKRTPVACNAASGDYTDDGVPCEPDTCVVQGGCCREGACTVEDPTACANGGIYLGNGTACVENACTTGACCRISGSCDPNIEQGGCQGPGEEFHTGQDCTGQCVPRGACCVGTECDVTLLSQCAGTYQGNGVECEFDTCAATGACCVGASCTTETSANCASGGGTYQGDNVSCAANPCTAVPSGACCIGTSCSFITQSACASGGGTFQGDNVACAVNTCAAPATGACCNGTTCSVTTQTACTSGGGTYKGDGVVCGANTCTSGSSCTALISTDPVNCSVDARRPHAPGAPGTPQGRNSLTMTFGSACTALPADFTVSCSPTATPCPTVSNVSAVGATQTITLSTVIPAGNWTCVTHTATNAKVCMGSLPGDIDGNRTTVPADIIKLIDNLNGVANPPLLADHCDMDRSNQCLPADIITLIDMLNGTNGFIVWNGKNLPVCPP